MSDDKIENARVAALEVVEASRLAALDVVGVAQETALTVIATARVAALVVVEEARLSVVRDVTRGVVHDILRSETGADLIAEVAVKASDVVLAKRLGVGHARILKK